MIQLPALLYLRAAVVLVVVAIVFGLFGWTHQRGHVKGAQSVQQQWDKERALVAQARTEAEAAARRKERDLWAAVEKLKQEKDSEAKHLAARFQRVIDGLRHRPERPAPADHLPATAGVVVAAAACTGAQLYRPDAEFLARESERADQLRIALKECQASYNEARQKLKGAEQ